VFEKPVFAVVETLAASDAALVAAPDI
jgi:hypothetical protein